MGFSLMLLTILNPALSLWTRRPSCAACRPPLSPRPSNSSDFYCLCWWDIHKETFCQQDGEHVPCSVLMCLLERSWKSNRASGSSLCSPGGCGLASSGWGKLVGNARRDRFIDGSLLYWFPATEPHEHLRMSFSMTHLRAMVPLQEALRDQGLS